MKLYIATEPSLPPLFVEANNKNDARGGAYNYYYYTCSEKEVRKKDIHVEAIKKLIDENGKITIDKYNPVTVCEIPFEV